MKNLEFRIEKEELKKTGGTLRLSVLNSQFSIAFVVLTFLWFVPSARGELSFKFKPGDKFFLLSVHEQKTVQITDGNEQVIEQTVRFGCDLDIEEVDPNVILARYTYRQFALNKKGPNIDIRFDSAENQTRIPIEVLPLYLALEESFYIKITPQGRIIGITGLPALITSAKARTPFSAVRGQVMEAIDRNFEEKSIKSRLEEQLAVFPSAKEANDGNTVNSLKWTRVQDVNEDPRHTQLWLYQLKERRDGVAVIDVNVAISPAGDLNEVVMAGVKARREVSGKGSGIIEIEEATGRIISEKLTRETVDAIKASPEGPFLRLPPLRSPIKISIIKTFQMSKME